MHKIYITSLTKHRIDELLADYAAKALESIDQTKVEIIRGIPEEGSRPEGITLLVFNGVNDINNVHCMQVNRAMDLYDTFYFIDDHTTSVPWHNDNVTIVSQFTNMHPIDTNRRLIVGMKRAPRYFQISKLATLGKKYTKTLNEKTYDMVYWGHVKPERIEEYKKHLPNQLDTLIIGDREEWLNILPNATIIPFKRDMNELYQQIAQGRITHIVGDKFHNGVNIPWRIYEAYNCGLMVVIDSELAGNQKITDHYSIDDIAEELADILFNGYKFSDVYEPTIEESDGPVYIPDVSTCESEEFICNPSEEEVTPPNIMEAKWVDEEELKEMYPDRQGIEPPYMKINTDEVLEQRGQIYGEYSDGVKCRAKILDALRELYSINHTADMPEALQIMFGDLILKMMRITSDPTHIDSFVDLEGYAKIIKIAVEEGILDAQ